MNEESLLKRTLVLTAKLVGVFAVWIALLSFVVVTVTGRAVLALSGESAEKGATAPDGTRPKDDVKRSQSANPAVNASKPNG